MAIITASLAQTEADDVVSAEAERVPAAGRSAATSRVRSIAYPARLDLALRATAPFLSRGRTKLRPAPLTEIAQSDRVSSRTDIDAVNSASFGWQTSTQTYPGYNPHPPIRPLH